MKNGLPWRIRVAMAKAAAAKRGTTLRTVRPDTKPGHNPHKKRGIVPWNTPRMWEGETVCIIGGGPSLKGFDLTPTRGSKVIAVNNAYEIAPWADLLFFADCSWWQWNRNAVLRDFPLDRIIATATSDVKDVNHERIKRLWRDRNKWCEDPQKVHGWDSGTMAVNLAYHLGAAKIVLFGFDMQPGKNGETQWHSKHKRRTAVSNYKDNFIPRLTGAVETLAKKGIPVVRCTEPGLECIPVLPVDVALTR